MEEDFWFLLERRGEGRYLRMIVLLAGRFPFDTGGRIVVEVILNVLVYFVMGSVFTPLLHPLAHLLPLQCMRQTYIFNFYAVLQSRDSFDGRS